MRNELKEAVYELHVPSPPVVTWSRVITHCYIVALERGGGKESYSLIPSSCRGGMQARLNVLFVSSTILNFCVV